MANISKSIQEILATTGQTITAYEVYRVLQSEIAKVNEVRAAALRPQMMYNYSKNGLIVKGRKASNGPVYYTVPEVIAFIDRYMQKNFQIKTTVQTLPCPFENVSDENLVDGPVPTAFAI